MHITKDDFFYSAFLCQTGKVVPTELLMAFSMSMQGTGTLAYYFYENSVTVCYRLFWIWILYLTTYTVLIQSGKFSFSTDFSRR
jgi:hypothetical protein